MENKENKQIGKVKTVLVSPDSPQMSAISQIIVKTCKNHHQRITFTGSVLFSDRVKKHIIYNILPLADKIIESVGLSLPNYQISAVNPDIASKLDTAVSVSGFSADLSVFLATLSAALQTPLPQDHLFTGCISSADGDIGPVGSIDAKTKAAAEDENISKFIYPKANSLEKIYDLDKVITEQVSDISELIETAFDKTDIVFSSLMNCFFLAEPQSQNQEYLQRSYNYLAAGNDKHFWQILKQLFMASKTSRAKELLKYFAEFFIAGQDYPKSFGQKLFSVICCVPAFIKRDRQVFPLIGTGLCIKLASFAKENDYEDVFKLFDAVRGKVSNDYVLPQTAGEPSDEQTRQLNIFDKVVSQINQDAIAKDLASGIDMARSTFILDSVTIENYQQFLEIIRGLYIHLKNAQVTEAVDIVDQSRYQAEAIELAEKTFAQKGGIEAAVQRAKDGTAGGMRKVLDEITDFYKQDQQRKHIKAVFRRFVDDLSWQEKTEFMKCAMERLSNFLPEDLRDQPPERFARSYEAIAIGYVESMEQFNKLIKRY